MAPGARTPEELDTLLEDAIVLRDERGCAALFEDVAVLGDGNGLEARGGEAIGRALAELWARDRIYLAGTTCVLRTHDMALLVAAAGVHVVRRRPDGTWRAAISLLDLPATDRSEDDMTHDTDIREPLLTRAGEGEARWWFGGLAEIKLTAERTGGLLSVLEITEPPGMDGPLHVHHRDDETFWIVEGDATFVVGDAVIEASAGDLVFAPHGIPHRYSVGQAGCRMLYIMTPGGFERLVREMSVPAASRTLPPAADEEPDWEHVAAVAKANGCELLA